MSNFDPDWWRKIFDDVYLITDARSIGNAQVNRVEVNLVEDLLCPGVNDRILDLCGGQGRHAIELAKRGYKNVVVADYSYSLLAVGVEEAKKQGVSLDFVRCDARSLCMEESRFDHVIIMGNSFGYFRDDRDNRAILSEVSRILKNGGRIIVDLVSRRYIVNNFVPSSWHEAGNDTVVCRSRTLETDGLLVREMVLSKERGLVRDITYFTRLFYRDELYRLFSSEGFKDISFIGEFKPHGSDGDYGMLTNRVIVSAIAG